jgi:FKBP-type peptidyl-prolyl cis-trans isomerase FkpA
MNMSSYKQLFLMLAIVLLAPIAQAAESEEDKTFYYLGMGIYKNLKLEMLNLSEDEAEQVVEGLSDSLEGDADELDEAIYGPKLQDMSKQRMMASAEREAQAGQDYISKMAAEAGAIQTASGLVYKEVQLGDGAQPTATSKVKAHYKGTLRDGSEFDTSYSRGKPISIGLNQVIPCWTEGIAMMKEGGKAVLTCPSDIAYGPRGQGSIPPNAVLTFEVELIEVELIEVVQ